MKAKDWMTFISKLPPEVEVKAETFVQCEKKGYGLKYRMPDDEKSTVLYPKDTVNHPSHYETGKFECIDVMVETQGEEATKAFCICNALKYLYRHKRKNGLEDVKKAIWYLNKYVEMEEAKA